MHRENNYDLRPTVTILVFVAGFSLVSCNSLRVDVGKAVPPDFTFHVGRFAECCEDFRIFAVLEEGSEIPQRRIVADHAVKSSESQSLIIHYGKVPDRFKQEIPTAGEPPVLLEGKR